MVVKDKNIILSSNSPRRQQLLRDLGIKFEIKTMETEESYPDNMPVSQIASYLAEKKANAFLPHISANDILLTADTVVITNNRILNKPGNQKEAIDMLQELQGKVHHVMTGVCIADMSKRVVFSDETEVSFAKLTDQEISFYIEKFKPYDKAGAYGIQEWIGLIGISSIKGSYYNVMGLPVHRIYQALKTNYNLTF
jgi:septum formation protein